jgi:hypothetical protein
VTRRRSSHPIRPFHGRPTSLPQLLEIFSLSFGERGQAVGVSSLWPARSWVGSRARDAPPPRRAKVSVLVRSAPPDRKGPGTFPWFRGLARDAPRCGARFLGRGSPPARSAGSGRPSQVDGPGGAHVHAGLHGPPGSGRPRLAPGALRPTAVRGRPRDVLPRRPTRSGLVPDGAGCAGPRPVLPGTVRWAPPGLRGRPPWRGRFG